MKSSIPKEVKSSEEKQSIEERLEKFLRKEFGEVDVINLVKSYMKPKPGELESYMK